MKARCHRGLQLLTAPIKNYEWGSTGLLAELTGGLKTGKPQAEMWFGTHSTTPTLLDDGTALADLTDLPYLVKLIAAAQPLSVQVHPGREQARSGFSIENSAGIPLDSPERTYRDPNHKPEMLLALTDFTAMAGFRAPRASAATFRLLADLMDEKILEEALTSVATRLTNGQLKRVFTHLVDPQGPFRASGGWTRAIFASAARHGPSDRYLANALSAATIHPGDPGALVTLLMNLTVLSPGEALYIPSNTIHSYVSGLGLEVMATSDNVIRGGLTVKHVDIPELHRVVSYQPSPVPLIAPTVHMSSDVLVSKFSPPVNEFEVTRYDLAANTTLTQVAGAPHILICISGSGHLILNDQSLEVSGGVGVYLPGSVNPLVMSASNSGMTIIATCQPGAGQA